uniref:Rhodanese domain-containing protein n=1 Tax=Romanomermis culicivorax TaxID=13658 RepID=A0A915ITZ0_ROMCU
MTGRKNGPQIADARQPDYYHGKAKHKDAKDAGRILGALNVPVEEVIRSDTGGFKILPDVKAWLTNKGVTMERPTVLYSDSGMHASGLYFLISQTGTKQNVKVYHNGWIEWSYKAPEQLKERTIMPAYHQCNNEEYVLDLTIPDWCNMSPSSPPQTDGIPKPLPILPPDYKIPPKRPCPSTTQITTSEPP